MDDKSTREDERSVSRVERPAPTSCAPTRMHLRVAWLEVPHPGLGYYSGLLQPLQSLGNNITVYRARTNRGFAVGTLASLATATDVAFVSFGFFPMESGRLPLLADFEMTSNHTRNHTVAASAKTKATLCGVVPLVVLINKEYVLMSSKLAWLQSHCVRHALTVHHDIERYEAATGVPFSRIWFGVDMDRFALNEPTASATAMATMKRNHKNEYEYDIGFTGVVRHDQTANWRCAPPALRALRRPCAASTLLAHLHAAGAIRWRCAFSASEPWLDAVALTQPLQHAALRTCPDATDTEWHPPRAAQAARLEAGLAGAGQARAASLLR